MRFISSIPRAATIGRSRSTTVSAPPLRASAGGVLVALADRLAMVDLDDESVRTLVEIPHGEGLRLNDGACDPAGRFWVGSMALDYAPGAGALYRYSGEEGLDRVLEDVTLSNGLGWSPDGGTMYYIDSMAYRVDAFDFDVATGAISERRPLIVIERGAGIPDGLAVDDEGGIWVALWGRARHPPLQPGRRARAGADVPADNVTACCFGGDDGRSLYVTTASVELPAEREASRAAGGQRLRHGGRCLRAACAAVRRVSRSRRVGEEDGTFGG